MTPDEQTISEILSLSDDKAKIAMIQLHEKQKSIAFAEWLEEKYVRSGYKRLTGEVLWKRKASGKSTIEELTAENTAGELYTLFLQSLELK